MSRRLLQCCAVAYQHGRTAFNAKLIRRAQRLLSLAAAGGSLSPESASTIVLAEIRNGMLTVLNTGDSRAYVIDKT
jgi:serine/threonine protein phosphatase PrpC